MIRRTIREHLDKELRLNTQQIKVLTLFSSIRLISTVSSLKKDYVNRVNNMPASLKKNILKQSKALHIKIYFPSHPEHAKDVHDGYLSIDKKGAWAETSGKLNNTGREKC